MLELVEESHPILSVKMPAVPEGTDLEALTKDMFLIMWSNGGIGLAAPQVGIALRVFIMGPQEGPHYVCINPEIIEAGSEEIGTEGCLSYPALWLNIRRPTWVRARYQTLDGQTVEQRFEGLLARCYVHELDHLNGLTFDKLSSSLSLKLAKVRQQKKLRKLKR
jgi:peptide deformylase